MRRVPTPNEINNKQIEARRKLEAEVPQLLYDIFESLLIQHFKNGTATISLHMITEKTKPSSVSLQHINVVLDTYRSGEWIVTQKTDETFIFSKAPPRSDYND